MLATLFTPVVAQDFKEGDLLMTAAAALAAILFFGFILILIKRYKRCPSNRVLVIYGKTRAGQSSKTLHGGGAFVWPLIQNYDYLSLDPMQIEIPLEGALSLENIRVSVPSVFTVAIGTDEAIMNNAAVRLLGLRSPEIMKQAEDIIFGQLRQVIASMRITEINRDRDRFLSSVQQSLEPELSKIGLVLINVNIKDITDESGYIEAIGRKAASEAIQQASIDVADQEKLGAIGVADADRVRMIEVAEAEKLRDIGTKDAERERAVRLAELDKEKIVGEQGAAFAKESEVRDAERLMRIRVADANAKAVAGENVSKAEIAQADASLKVEQANAFQIGETRRREAEAAVQEAQFIAEAKAAMAEATKVEAETRAEFEAVAKAQKARIIVDAEAEAERRRIHAEGEASAIFAKLDAEARGQYEILAKKGQGLHEIVKSCGGSREAFQLLMLEHLDHLAETAASAISNIKFDKVIVWDGGNTGKDGEPGGAAGFLRGMAGALPPTLQMMKDIGGVEMPEFFGKLTEEAAKASETTLEGGAETAGEGEAETPPASEAPSGN